MKKNLLLHFGIPSLDRLLGRRDNEGNSTNTRVHQPADPAQEGRNSGGNSTSALCGLFIDEGKDGRFASTSLCIVGPDGAGKSVLGLHLASRYAAQTFQRSCGDLPAILYVSTDLNYHKAYAVWQN